MTPPAIADSKAELEAVFRDLHARPETGLTESSAIVAEAPNSYDVDEVHQDLYETGVVGLIHGMGQSEHLVGLRRHGRAVDP